jgi:2-haloacid dehalogenase
MNAETLRRSIKVCMFDQYGTIVDMQGGLREVAAGFLEGKGWKGNANDFVTWWRRTHFENSMIDALLHRQHTPYREIGHLSVDHVLRRASIAHTHEEVRWLVSCIERLKPFPEVPEALARLQTRYKLVVLSNGDPDMLEEAKKHHRIPFDAVISVAEANALSRMSRPTRRQRSSAAWRWARCCSSPITSSTASAPRRPACVPPSSIAAVVRSRLGRISPI